jgi:hypothetical protein
MDEAKLREKLSKIEALFAGATTEGERIAAGEVRIPARSGHPFRPDPATRSDGTRPPIPVTRPPVPTGPATDSGDPATRSDGPGHPFRRAPGQG